mgnify:FL=1
MERKTRSSLATAVGVGLMTLACAAPQPPAEEGDPIDWAALEPGLEADIALSAAPPHLREGAEVWVLGDDGFERVRRGTNGFACLVVRAGPVFAPMCLDPEGVRTTLQDHLMTAELAARGLAAEAVADSLRTAYGDGRLEAPGPGIAYMLSPDFVRFDRESGEVSTVFPPHLMFYAPYRTNEDIGALPDHVDSHVHPYVLSPGTPGAVIIVVPNPALGGAR